MDVTTHCKDGVSKLLLRGRFDFTAHRAFKQAYEAALLDEATHDVMIDLSGVDYLDSSALGMLLILRDRAKETEKKISLGHCSDSVREVLKVANFDKLFGLV